MKRRRFFGMLAALIAIPFVKLETESTPNQNEGIFKPTGSGGKWHTFTIDRNPNTSVVYWLKTDGEWRHIIDWVHPKSLKPYKRFINGVETNNREDFYSFSEDLSKKIRAKNGEIHPS